MYVYEHDVLEEAADAISYAKFLQTLVKVPMQFTVCVCVYVNVCVYVYEHDPSRRGWRRTGNHIHE